MAATTAFYGSLNALKSSISIIVDIDMKLTNLQKVMSQDTNFALIMDNARISAEKFGKTLSEVLDAYTEFARQGYKEQDLINLGDAGLITSNVGEMTSARAAEYLTSAMVQYNMATKDSMKVIDSWNNVSNKNATTVEKLAAGMAKAGATANAFGVDMNQLNAIIGTVTAATKQSGNEVGNFIKSALPRLLGKPAQAALKSLNIKFIDENTGDMRKVVDIYGEVAEKVKNITKVEKMAVMEGLAGKQHISRMTAMIDHWDMYNKMVNESTNSEGSAERENEKYMKSLTARIALMKQSVEEIALSLGKAFLTEGFIQTLEIIKSLAHGFVGISKVVGGLPLILGAAGVAATLLSKNLQGVAIQGTVLSRMFTALGITSKALQVTIASIGVGSALFAFGIILEQVLKKMSDARERAEEFARKNRELTESYKENRKDIQGLSEEYEKLDKKIRNGTFDTKDIEKYKNITAQLASLMPDLVVGEDQYGNKIIGSNEAIKAKITLLEKQTAAQEKADAIARKTEVQDNYKSSGKDLNSAKKDLDNFFISDANQTPFVSNIKEAYKALEEYQNKLANGEKLNLVEKGELDNIKNTIDSYETLKSEVDGFKLAYQQSVMDMIDVNVKLDGSTSQLTKSLINDFTTFVATSEATEGQITSVLGGVLNSVQNDNAFKTTLQSYSSAIKSYQDAVNEGTDTQKIEDYRNKAVEAFTTVKNTLLGLANSGGLKDTDLNAISAQMDSLANSALMTSVDFNKLSESTGKSVQELQANLSLAPQMEDAYNDTGDAATYSADSIDGETSALNGNSDAKLENVNAASILFGVTSDQIAQMENAVAIVQMLSDVENLSAQQKGLLAQATSILAAQYPNLNGAISDNIDWISTQVGYMSALGNVSGSSASTMIKNQNSTTKATIAQINQRIRGYQKEFAALSSLMSNIERAYETEGMSGAKSAAYANASKRLTQINAELASAQASLVEVTYGSGVRTGQIKVDKPSTKTNSGASKGNKTGSGKSNSSDKKVEKVIDPFEDKLHDYDEDIKKSEAIQKRYKEGSAQWIAEEKKQIGFIEKKRLTVIAEKKALEKLLKTGKLDKDQKKEVNNRIKELITTQEEYTTAIKENTQAIIETQIAAKIAATESAYDKEIAALQKKLDLMDEEEKKEDRKARRKELQDQLDKAKSDTRYEYVDKNGKVQLTYDKAEVARIEKEKKDQEAEWKKEDDRAALEKKIADTEALREKAVAALTKLQETYFKKSIKNADDMKKVLSQLSKDLDKIYKGNLPKHHSGGISGGKTTKLGEMFNQMVNAKSDEQVSLLKKGEIIVNPMLPHVQNNLNKLLSGLSTRIMPVPTGNSTTLNFNNVTIQTENGATFLKDLDMHIRMNKN